MDKQQQKQYILKHFKLSSGKKITEMLKRYWSNNEYKNSAPDIVETTENIFND